MSQYNSSVLETAESMEIWKPVVGYEEWYEVSNFGRVKRIKSTAHSAKSGKVLKPTLTRNGYARIRLWKDNQGKRYLVHRLVALAHLGEPPTPQHEINHINCVRDDNRLENLEWCTASENMKYAYKLGRVKISLERNPNVKLNWEKVREIRKLLKSGYTQARVANRFNVSQAAISLISRNEQWVEVTN